MPYLRAIRQPRLRWIMTAGHVIPPAAELAMAQHAQARIVKGRRLPPVDDLLPRSGDSPDRRRCPQHQLKGQRVVMVAETGKEPTR
jgi:hypothetical protein